MSQDDVSLVLDAGTLALTVLGLAGLYAQIRALREAKPVTSVPAT